MLNLLQKIKHGDFALEVKYLFFCIFSLLLLFSFLGCATLTAKSPIAEKNQEEIAALKKVIAEQQEIINNLQNLTSDLMIMNSELEQSIPPRDLLESLQSEIIEFRQENSLLNKKLVKLSNEQKEPKVPMSPTFKILEDQKQLLEDQKQLLEGLVSLQAGNPDQAAENLKQILNQKKTTKLKSEILIAVAYSFLEQGYFKQAASHYGKFLREFQKSPLIPQALFYLGESMKKLGEEKKQKVLWDELIENYPESIFTKRIK